MLERRGYDVIEVSRIETTEGLSRLEKEWSRLVEQCQNKNIFLTFEWVSLWWKHLRGDKELYVLVARQDKDIVGIAPLMVSKIKRPGIHKKKLEFIGMPLSDYSDLILADMDAHKKQEIVQAFLEFLKKNRKDWSLISLNRIPEGSQTLDLIRKAKKPCLFYGRAACDVSPRLIREAPGAANPNQAEVGESAKSLGRSVNRFLRDGKGRIESCSKSKADCSALLEQLFRQHIMRWEGSHTPSMFNDENYRRFFIELMKKLIPAGLADIIYIHFQKKPAAFLLVFKYNDVFSDYMTTSDLSLSKHSPGRVLLKLSLESEASKRFKVYDFMRGGHKYKLKYANRIVRLYNVMMHKNMILFILDYMSCKMEFLIKQNERLYEFFLRFEKKLRLF